MVAESSCLILELLRAGLELRHPPDEEGGGVTDEQPNDSLFPIMTVSISYQKFWKKKEIEMFSK